MIFSSVIFLFLFLPFCLALYFLTPKKGKNLFLLFASLIFYAWGEGPYVLILLISIFVNYSCGLLIDHHRGSSVSRGYLAIAIVLNLSLLAFFKYANFVVTNLNAILPIFGAGPFDPTRIHLPIGISFFTFQALSYVVDVYNQKITAQKNVINFGTYLSLFPQLVAGPIVRYAHIAKEIISRSTSRMDFAEGSRQFLFGLGKKMLIANSVAKVADQLFSLPAGDLTTGLAWLGAICYTLQIYFDFSGYSDMAIGLARMFGFHYPENFNYPYISQSIREFWRRWHISLSTWFRDYLYLPLGGNRQTPIRTYLNLVAVFLLCGLWHGASWNFIIWGLFHGFFLATERTFLGRGLNALPRPVKHIYTLLIVTVGWVIFRTESMTHAVSYLAAMSGFAQGAGVKYNVAMFLSDKLKLEMGMGILLSAPVYLSIKRMEASIVETGPMKARTPLNVVFNLLGFVLLTVIVYASIISLAASAYNPFIYSGF
ncbi:MAG TPA: MBOAT family protein [Thermodesulfobacteriota bacterium]|nr:MBOAT family protein [Thermodesulfobacteriota bacterium]